jgi:thiol-disulfide isomerase/thioredoxin
MDPIQQRVLSLYDQLERESLDLHTMFEFVGGNNPKQREAVLDTVSALVKSGLLKEGESDFYARTEDGRLAIVNPREITLYTREGCTLCEEARVAIAPLAQEFSATLREVDIDDDPVLHERYTNDIPVVFLGSRLVAQHRVNAAQLRRQLDQLPK